MARQIENETTLLKEIFNTSNSNFQKLTSSGTMTLLQSRHAAVLLNARDECCCSNARRSRIAACGVPCGGKLKWTSANRPYACACREAREETALSAANSEDCILTGLRQRAWLSRRTHCSCFCSRWKPRPENHCRPNHSEGVFNSSPAPRSVV